MSDGNSADSGPEVITIRYGRYEITVEATLIHKLTRADVDWTDEQWARAVEKAIANDRDEDLFVSLDPREAEEGYIEDVRARVLADDERPYVGQKVVKR